MSRTIQLAALSLIGLTLAACGQTTPTPAASSATPITAQLAYPEPCPLSINSNRVPVDGCGDPPPPPDPTDDTILAPGAQILDNAVIAYSEGDGTLVVNSTPVTNAYSVGNVVIGGISPVTPGGVPPRRIIAISDAGGTRTLLTEEAGLTDVVEQGSVDFARTLTVADIALVEDPAYPASRVSGQQLMQTLSVSCSTGGTSLYSKSFSKSLDGSSTLNGCFGLNLDTILKLKISHFKLDTFEASVKLTEEAKLELEMMAGSASMNHEWNLGAIWFNPIDIQLGPVPLLITPYIKFTAGVDGTVTGAFSYTASQTASYKAGLQYANGKVSTINQRAVTLNAPAPTLSNTTSLKATAKAYVEARPGISFFTTIIAAHADGGVYAGVRAYAKADVDTQRHPLWQLTAGPQFCYGYQAHLEVLLGLIDKTWSGDKCGSEIRMFELHSSDVGPVLPSNSNAWNNVSLNFNITEGEIEIYKTDPSGATSFVTHLTSSGPFDLTPYIDPVDDTDFTIVGISKRSSGIFGSYRHHFSMTVTADGDPIWPVGEVGCTGCGSREEIKFTINKNLALLQPN